MDEQKTKELVEAFPQLWGGLRGGAFECGDGWYTLIRAASDALRDRARCEGFVIVKEKFGRLEIQGLRPVEGEDYSYILGVTTMAMLVSLSTCEQCGASSGERRGGSYIQTLCDDCYEPEPDDDWEDEG